MAQETVGYNIYARFQFFGKAGTTQMKQTSMAFASLRRNATLARAGVTQAATGIRTLSMVGIGAAFAIGKVVKVAAGFNQQMAVVKSVTSLTAMQFKSLNDKALQLGSTTTFTAKEVGKGMENFGRASFTAIEIANAIRPALKMAEADSMKLGDSTRILADGMRIFGLKADKTSYAVDVLAYASKNSNTNIMGLGEGLAYAGPAAARAKMNFHETVGVLGLLANIGIKASRSGTVLKNAWNKLTAMSRPAIKLFGGKAGLLKVLTDNNGKMKKFHMIIGQTILKLKSVKNEAIRNNLAFKIFGIRGGGALDALMRARPGEIAKMMVNIKEASKGTAEEMARIQQANLAGDWKRFTSAVSGAAIAMGNALIPTIRKVFEGTSGLTATFGKFAGAIKMMNEGATESAVLKKYGQTVAGIVFGIKEGFASAKATLKDLGKIFMEVFGQFIGTGKNTVKTIARIVTKFVVLAAALAPVALAIGGVAFVAKGMFNVVAGGIKIVTALTSPWGIAFIVIIRLFAGAKRKGESLFATMARGLKNVTAFAYKLTAPFRWLIKQLGIIPGLITAIVAAKGFKLLIGGLGGGLARGAVGAAGGGLLARSLGGGAAAGAAAAGAGRAAPWAAGVGMAGKTATGAALVGKFVPLFAAVMQGVAVGHDLVQMARGEFKATRGWSTMASLLPERIKRAIERREEGPNFASMVSKSVIPVIRKLGSEARVESAKKPVVPPMIITRALREFTVTGGQARPETMKAFGTTVVPFLKRLTETAKWTPEGARRELAEKGIKGETLRRFIADLSVQQKETYKFTPAMIKALQDLSKSMGKPKAPTIIQLNLDGKKLTTVTATHRQESRERAGRVSPPGARRRALRTGTE